MSVAGVTGGRKESLVVDLDVKVGINRQEVARALRCARIALAVVAGCFAGHVVFAGLHAKEQKGKRNHPLPWPRERFWLRRLKDPRLRRPSPMLVRFLVDLMTLSPTLYIAIVLGAMVYRFIISGAWLPVP